MAPDAPVGRPGWAATAGSRASSPASILRRGKRGRTAPRKCAMAIIQRGTRSPIASAGLDNRRPARLRSLGWRCSMAWSAATASHAVAHQKYTRVRFIAGVVEKCIDYRVGVEQIFIEVLDPNGATGGETVTPEVDGPYSDTASVQRARDGSYLQACSASPCTSAAMARACPTAAQWRMNNSTPSRACSRNSTATCSCCTAAERLLVPGRGSIHCSEKRGSGQSYEQISALLRNSDGKNF